MKKYFWILTVIIIILFDSCLKNSELEREKEAIKSVIEAEIKSSFYGDYKSWSELFTHGPNTCCFYSDQGTCYSWSGWEEISLAATDFIKPERTRGKIYEGYYDYSVRFCEESALVTFKTKLIDIQLGDEYDCEITSTEMRFLEKQEDQWKITHLLTAYSIDNE